MKLQAKVNALRVWWSSRARYYLARSETQSKSTASGMTSILDKAFKGEL
jgi:hypothetical protein